MTLQSVQAGNTTFVGEDNLGCENIHQLLSSDLFYETFGYLSNNQHIINILKKIGQNIDLSDREKYDLKSFLESDNTKINGKRLLNLLKRFIKGKNVSIFLMSIFQDNQGINNLVQSIADSVGVILKGTEQEKELKLGIPEIPEFWKSDSSLTERYNIFKKLALNNEDWWNKFVKGKIELGNEYIIINGVKLSTAINTRLLEWNGGLTSNNETSISNDGKYIPRSIPVKDMARNESEYRSIYNFLCSLGENHKKELMKFLGITDDNYWMKGNNDSTRLFHSAFNFTNGTVVNSLPNSTGCNVLL